MSSTSLGGAAKATSSDTPWIIGSALIFGPALLWCLAPPSDSPHHAHPNQSKPKHSESGIESTTKDDEGTAISAAEVETSINAAIDADTPKNAKTSEASKPSETDSYSSMSEDDGVVVSTEDVEAPTEQTQDTESSKDTQEAEVQHATTETSGSGIKGKIDKEH